MYLSYNIRIVCKLNKKKHIQLFRVVQVLSAPSYFNMLSGMPSCYEHKMPWSSECSGMYCHVLNWMSSDVLEVMMEAAHTFETSVEIQLRTWQFIPEDSELHTRCCENLKSHKMPCLHCYGHIFRMDTHTHTHVHILMHTDMLTCESHFAHAVIDVRCKLSAKIKFLGCNLLPLHLTGHSTVACRDCISPRGQPHMTTHQILG
jgi:hypothetical protein